MSDIKSMIKDLETIVEHGASEIHKATRKEEHTPQEIEAIKNIAKLAYYHQILKAMDEAEEDDGYSRGGYSMYDGSSYARGRRRDSMGRYSRRGGYSMDDSREAMMQKLEEAMREATAERERQAIEQCMNKMM